MEHFTHSFAVVAALCAGLMAGNEFAVAAFFHPVLCGLPDELHAQAAKPLAQKLGKFMPFWYAASFLLSLGLAFLVRGSGLAFGLVAASAACFLLGILATVFFLVPLNNRIAAWDKSVPEAQWKRDRALWDSRHRVRVVGLVLAFGLLLGGIIASP